MKILIDMNLSPRWVDFLSAAGLETTHWSSIGIASALDSEIMTFAAENGYVVLTHDLDFTAILAATKQAKPSVVQIRSNDLRIETIGKQILTALTQMQSELTNGALVSIDTFRARIRLLPLQT